MKVKNVVFDLDGTLLDTLEDLYLSVNVALRNHGYPERSRSEVRSFLGRGLRALAECALPDCAKDKTDEIFAELKAYYDVHKEDNTAPYDGVVEALGELKKAGVSCAIVSNKFDSAVQKLKESCFDGLVDFACGEREGCRPKPAPDGVLLAMRELGATKEDTAYVGDGETDLETANNAGLRFIAVSWGFRDKCDLEARGAKTIVDTPSQMLDAILKAE